MQEKVGSVTLDLSWYGGSDQYSDGAVEDELLEIVRTTPEEELNRVIGERKDWAVLYHLSDVRENIVSALPITKKDRVLEIGAGCGAITGALARMAGEVTCVDLSYRRSLINAHRHAEADNVKIIVGNYQDIEPHLEERYDYITLIGVFEYAQGYIGTEKPYAEFLRQICEHLAPGGKIIMAIENRLGLKYWAGCREDHTGHLFEGLENYPNPCGVRTFARPELEKLFAEAGLSATTFAYPYPDYKLPSVIYSDEYLPKEGQLTRNVFNYDRERLLLFDETKVFDSLIAAGQFPLFANSYLITLMRSDEALLQRSGEDRVIFSKFSGERADRCAIRTDILEGVSGRKVVKKALKAAGRAHILHLEKAEKALSGQYPMLNVNRVIDAGEDSVTLEYLTASRTLDNEATQLLAQGRREDAFALVRRVCDLIRSAAKTPFAVTEDYTALFGPCAGEETDALSAQVTDVDMLLENLLVQDDGYWQLIDYEWTYDFPIPVDYVCYRVWHYFLSRSLPGEDSAAILQAEGFTAQRLQRYAEMEENWQSAIAGDKVTLGDLYQPITPGRRDVVQEMMLGEGGGNDNMGILYYRQYPETTFAQDRTMSVRLNKDENGAFRAVLNIEKLDYLEELRWDPLETVNCRIHIDKMEAEGDLTIAPLMAVSEDGWDNFWNLDPAYMINGDFSQTKQIVIYGTLQRVNQQDIAGRLNAALADARAAREEVNAIHATKGDQMLVKMRQMRQSGKNFAGKVKRHLPFVGAKNVPDNGRYNEWFLRHRATPNQLEAQRHMSASGHGPVVSILVPTYYTPENFLREMITSVIEQTYPNWQLCIADASVKEEGGEKVHDEKMRTVLEEYAKLDERICVVYLDSNDGIAENTNRAAEIATGDYIALLDHDDLLAPDALFESVRAIMLHDADMVYTDEDKVSMDGKVHFDPNLKPDFSPDLLRSHNYITHFLTVKKSLFDQVGGFKSRYDGAQDYDLILKCSEQAQQICHVPKVLYHWRMHQNSTAQNPESKMYAYEAGKRAIEDHLMRCGEHGKVEIMDLWGMYHVTYDVPEEAKLSIIIPNKDHLADLEKCVRSIVEKSTFRNFEIIVVENNSEEKATFEGYKRLKKKYPQVRLVKWEGPFNYSAINNYGAKFATGDYLLLLNNDTELIDPDSLSQMMGLCARKNVGCVGAKLLYADDTVQHAGIVLGFGDFGGFAGHVFHGIGKDDLGFMLRARIIGNFSAVTAACLMVRREVFDEVGGLDESFVVALNDVDFCLRVRKAGYVNVCTPFSLWHHYESKSRGYEDTPEKKERFKGEVLHFREIWGEMVDQGDPYYNVNFPLSQAPFTLD